MIIKKIYTVYQIITKIYKLLFNLLKINLTQHTLQGNQQNYKNPKLLNSIVILEIMINNYLKF